MYAGDFWEKNKPTRQQTWTNHTQVQGLEGAHVSRNRLKDQTTLNSRRGPPIMHWRRLVARGGCPGSAEPNLAALAPPLHVALANLDVDDGCG
jgi:hypothetical protein